MLAVAATSQATTLSRLTRPERVGTRAFPVTVRARPLAVLRVKQAATAPGSRKRALGAIKTARRGTQRAPEGQAEPERAVSQRWALEGRAANQQQAPGASR